MAAAPTTGVPIQLLHEAESHIVTVEMKSGEAYRGILSEAEETMNCQLQEVTMTSKDGRVSKLEHVFLRGGQIKFIVLPELLKNAPIFKKVLQLKAKKVDATGKSTLKGSKTSAKIRK